MFINLFSHHYLMAIKSDGELAHKIIEAVKETNPDKVQDVIFAIRHYDGSSETLDLFLQKFESYDPYVAASKAKLHNAVFRKSDEIKEFLDKYGVKGFSHSGHMLKNQLFLFNSTQNPESFFVSGIQAISKIMENFGTSEKYDLLTGQKADEIHSEKKRQAKQILKYIPETLEEILRDPSLIKDIQSTKDKQKVKYIFGLDEELEKRILQLNELILTNPNLTDQYSKTNLLALEEGGQLKNKLKKKLDSMPPRVRDAYTQYYSPYTTISQDRQKELFGIILSYEFIHTPINKHAALSGYISDFEYLNSLPETHEIFSMKSKKNFQLDLAKQSHWLYDHQISEIYLVDAVKAFDIFPIDAARKNLSQLYLSKYKEDLENKKQLEELFVKDKHIEKDSLSSSVPVIRLRESIYDKILDRLDFQNVKDLAITKVLAPVEDEWMSALSMKQFKTILDGVVLAKRKVDILKEALAKKKIIFEDSPKAIQKMKDEYLVIQKPHKFDLVENFENEHGLSIEEIVERLNHSYKSDRVALNAIRDLKLNLKYKIYSTKHIEMLDKHTYQGKSLLQNIKELIPKDEFKPLYDNYISIKTPDLITKIDEGFIDLRYKYIHPNIVEKTKQLTQAKQDLAKLQEQFSKQLVELLPKANILKSSKFYNVDVSDTKSIEVYESITVPLIKENNFQYWHPKQMIEFANTVSEQYINKNSLSDDKIERLKYLTSFKAQKELKSRGMNMSSASTWRTIKDFSENDNVYLEKSSIEKILKEMEN